jgi:hypothetical protein
VKRIVSISLDQLYRAQPGGIATYVRGLVRGLASLGDDAPRVMGLVPRGVSLRDAPELSSEVVVAPFSLNVLTRLWSTWPVGVPATSDVVHAATVAGPWGGGREDAVHSVALHDLLWRDEPGASTAHGIRFHERRLEKLKRRGDLRIIATAPGLVQRLRDDGFDGDRLYEVRLGVDDDEVTAASEDAVRSMLEQHGVTGPFTLYAGTREPRKNLERLTQAHARARARGVELGPLVIVGPEGWGAISTGSAIVLGLVSRGDLKGLLRDAAVFAYVPIAEGWGLPPVEALYAGTSVLASTATPSVRNNDSVVRVDPLDVEAIDEGLERALSLDAVHHREQRRASVADLTWRNAALDHLAAWR